MASAPAPSTNPAPMILGIISIVLGVIGSIISLIPCCGLFVGMPVAGIGLLLGIIGLIVALVAKQGMLLPILGSVFSVIGLIIGVVWIAIFGFAANEGAKQAEADRKAVREATNPIKITAADLGKKYADNVPAADGQYKKQILEVTGDVVSVTPGLYTTVQLKTNDLFLKVKCQFDTEQSASASALSPGKNVTIRGKCDGDVLGDITLNHCMVVVK